MSIVPLKTTSLPITPDLFIKFTKIGLFTVGGGYAVIPLIERDVVTRGWLESEPSALLGAILSTFVVCLPAFILILLITYSLTRFRDNVYFSGLLTGTRPLSIALIGFAAYILITPDNFIDA